MTSPLRPEQQQLANQLATNLDRDQALWLSGFFSGLAGIASAALPPTIPSAAKRKLTVLYGTESGNSEKLAGIIAKTAEKMDFKVTIASMSEAKPAALAKAENLLVIVSTWGEGDPPDGAVSYYETFMAEGMPQLPNVKYSVCGLGDTSYEHFCKMGKDFDARLAQLGGTRVHDRVDCDVDYQATFDVWLAAALKAFPGTVSELPSIPAAPSSHTAGSHGVYDKTNPYSSEVLGKILLNGTGSSKEVLHVELSLEGSGLTYEPGDALGICPENRASMIDEVLAATGLSANAKLGETTLIEALRHDFDITTLQPAIVDKYNAVAANTDLQKLLDEEGRATLKSWVDGRQLIDLLEAYPCTKTGLLRTSPGFSGNWLPDSTRSPQVLRSMKMRSISRSRQCVTTPTGVIAPAWLRVTSPTTSRWVTKFGSTSTTTTISVSPRATKPLSSWSDPAPGLLPSAPSSKNVPLAGPKERTGSSSATSISPTIFCISWSGSIISKTAP